jgi:hypothetical protein
VRSVTSSVATARRRAVAGTGVVAQGLATDDAIETPVEETEVARSETVRFGTVMRLVA